MEEHGLELCQLECEGGFIRGIHIEENEYAFMEVLNEDGIVVRSVGLSVWSDEDENVVFKTCGHYGIPCQVVCPGGYVSLITLRSDGRVYIQLIGSDWNPTEELVVKSLLRDGFIEFAFDC